MSPRQPYPRFQRCPSGQPGSMIYCVHGRAGGIVARIDREDYVGSRRIFRVRIEGEPHGRFDALRSAKSYIQCVVADRKLFEKGGLK